MCFNKRLSFEISLLFRIDYHCVTSLIVLTSLTTCILFFNFDLFYLKKYSTIFKRLFLRGVKICKSFVYFFWFWL